MNPEGAKNLYMGLNLSDLYRFSIWHYATLVSLIIFPSGLRAYIFYLVIKIFSKINFVHPFSRDVLLFISRISYIALGTGILTFAANIYCEWLAKKGVAFQALQAYLGDAGEFLLLGESSL